MSTTCLIVEECKILLIQGQKVIFLWLLGYYIVACLFEVPNLGFDSTMLFCSPALHLNLILQCCFALFFACFCSIHIVLIKIIILGV
jgi:hypothetical protein